MSAAYSVICTRAGSGGSGPRSKSVKSASIRAWTIWRMRSGRKLKQTTVSSPPIRPCEGSPTTSGSMNSSVTPRS